MALTDLAANLRRLRRSRDLTQAQVATLLRVSQPYICALEHGLTPRRLDHVQALARALVVSPAALLAPPPSRAEIKGTKKVRLKVR